MKKSRIKDMEAMLSVKSTRGRVDLRLLVVPGPDFSLRLSCFYHESGGNSEHIDF